MDHPPLTLEAVDRFVAERRKSLAFPDWLEWHFEMDTRQRRARRLQAAVPIIVVTYNLYLPLDWMLANDEITLALGLHFFLITPLILLTGWLTKDSSSKFLREALAGSIPVAIVVQILTIFVLTESPYAAHYQYFVLLVFLFTNTVQRLPFTFAIVVSCAIMACHSIAVLISGHMSGPIAMVATLTLAVSAYLTLTSNYYLERDSRRAYLHRLIDRLRHEAIETAAKHDPLTELANRRYLDEMIEQVWANTGEIITPAGVILIDVDHFKLYNDFYGHPAGDACLKRVAACVRTALRDGDLAVRYGGEEILILLPETGAPEASRIAERIRQDIEALLIPHEALGPKRMVTVSCGAAAAPIQTVTAQELIAAADAALYAAKRNGRNQVWPQKPHSGDIIDLDADSRISSRSR
jgi:diguanylate cyclase (GGDEF)-like protein